MRSIRPDDFQYAMENTRVVIRPSQTIETYGQTSFRFHMVTEPMDETGISRLRKGMIHAERPRILAPCHLSRLIVEGFGENARDFAEWMEGQADFHILRYGFSLKKTDLSEQLVRKPAGDLLSGLEEEIRREDNPLDTLIEGVDDAWEVCLMKFTMDLIRNSAGENMSEWKRRGFL
jgi:hypothetical protein